MAREGFDNWLPVEWDTNAVQRPLVQSAVEAVVPAVPMNANVKNFNRSGAAAVGAVAKGTAIPEDGATNDKVSLTAVKFAAEFRIANEDLDDSLIDILATKKNEWSIGYGKSFDNACLATSGAVNGLTVPFTSLYYSLTHADANAGYTANANYMASAGAVTYDKLSTLLGLVEVGDFYDPNSLAIIAHPSFAGTLRGLKDTTNAPLFQTDLSSPTGMRLFGLPLKYSAGAKVSATNTGAPTGNPIVAVINPNYAVNATRDPVEARLSDEAAISTDETLMVIRNRKAFGVTIPQAHALLEVTSA